MAESFPFSIATHILTKIASPAFKQICRSSGLQTDIRKLEETLSNLKADLLVAEEHQAQHQKLRDWLAELSDLLYDAEDALDELECKALRREGVNPAGSYKSNKVSRFFQSFKKNPPTIKKIEEKLCKIAATISTYLHEHTLSCVYSRERVINNSFVGTNGVFGRDLDKENIIILLTGSKDVENENISVIPIVGPEGLGKTTLAKIVYDDRRIDEYFELKMWVRVPDDFDVMRLLKKTYISATGQNYSGLAGKFTEHLRTILTDRKFLLVLDNVLNENNEKWYDFKNFFWHVASGSKLVVTTPSEKVESIMGTGSTYYIKEISPEASMSLFVKLAFRDGAENSYPHLINIGNEIVRKCGGVPLALKTLGALLYQNTDRSDWLLIDNNDMWKGINNILPAVLKLCYAHLPSHLRRCFVYCSLFPKGYRFKSDSLVAYWMAAGFLDTRNENEELEDVGLRYLKELCSRCFFQDIEDHGYYFTFQMHNLMHDLTGKVAQRECKMVDLRIGYYDREARHLSFLGIGDDDWKVHSISRNLRTIFMQSLEIQDSLDNFINKIVSNFQYLRLLCLNGPKLWKLSDSISSLKHLRCLDLSGNSLMEELSEAICELQSLQTLSLLGCSALKKLPKNMRKMISLRCLKITTQERRLPQNGIECLSSLRYLHLYGCHNLESFPEGMQSLTNLRTLVLQRCPCLNSLPHSIKYLKRLEKLVIDGCLNLNLKMELQGKEELCLNLREFVIYESHGIVELPQLILQGSANTLEYIRIEACPNLVALPVWLANLISLQKFEIVNCPGLSHLVGGMQNLTALRELKIQKSPTLSESCWQNLPNIIPHVREIHLDYMVALSMDN